MKRIFLLTVLLVLAGNSWAQSGANSVDVLGKMLYTAIKTNNFNLLNKYCLSEEQLTQLQQQSQSVTPDQTTALTATDYQTQLQTNFKDTILQRSSDTLSWKGVGLKHVKFLTPEPGTTQKQQASLQLTDDRERDFMVLFDVLPYNNSYYFMGNIKLANK